MANIIVQDLFTGIDLTGVLANAMLGGVMARAARMQPVGFIALAILTGLGGGMIRDTLLQHGTPVALTYPAYIPTALAGAAIAFFLPIEGRLWNGAFPFVDALALGCWAATGALKTLADGLAWLPALLLGTITAVGGGMTRDICLRRIPQIFAGGTLYTTCAVVASGVMVALYRVGSLRGPGSGHRDGGRADPAGALARVGATAGAGMAAQPGMVSRHPVTLGPRPRGASGDDARCR